MGRSREKMEVEQGEEGWERGRLGRLRHKKKLEKIGEQYGKFERKPGVLRLYHLMFWVYHR